MDILCHSSFLKASTQFNVFQREIAAVLDRNEIMLGLDRINLRKLKWTNWRQVFEHDEYSPQNELCNELMETFSTISTCDA